MLQRNGLLVETAINGQVAVDKATSTDYDVILMDMQMPVMDGYTATRKLREYGLDIPIVALTANAMRGDEEKCRHAGCSGFLTKPVDLDKLLNYLAELIGAEECDDLSGVQPGTQPSTPAIAVTPADTQSSPQTVGGPGIATLDEVLSTVQPASGIDPYDTANVFPPELIKKPKSPSPPRKPITSELPFDDPEFRAIIVGFVDKLRSEIDELQTVWQRRELDEVARIAHWLKGAAGTMGFRDFTEPGLKLMNLAREERTDEIASAIQELVEMVAAIEIPEPV